ncbi:hypothetical protein VTL71DRAFT_1759 [Oculimacula yallundae]|uniref:Uncharacterized protein n=1 Tax=Oculimacula yallundae TaxID=86028 RepID=A0ABR4CBQ9_9HELO
MGIQPEGSGFNGVPLEVRRMIYALASDRDPDNFFETKRIHIQVNSKLRIVPPPVPPAGQQAPDGQYIYDFWIALRTRPHNINFVNQETYRDYLARYHDTLELRGHRNRSDVVHFNARDAPSLFALADLATPLGVPIGISGHTGQGPPALLRSQQLLGFDVIQRIEWPPHNNLTNRMLGAIWLQANVLGGLIQPFNPFNFPLSRLSTRTTLALHYRLQVYDTMLALPEAQRPPPPAFRPNPLHAYQLLLENRTAVIDEFFRILPLSPVVPGALPSNAGSGSGPSPEQDDPDYPPPFDPGVPLTFKVVPKVAFTNAGSGKSQAT